MHDANKILPPPHKGSRPMLQRVAPPKDGKFILSVLPHLLFDSIFNVFSLNFA